MKPPTTTTTTTTTTTDDTDIPLHSRLADAAGCTGTVVWKGRFPDKKNEAYVGVRWDDPSRGKHNGTRIVDGQLHKYFECPHPTGASFIKTSKVNLGRPLTQEMLQDRYKKHEEPWHVADPHSHCTQHVVQTSNGKTKPIQFYGEMQIRKYQQLQDVTHISLRREQINSIQLPQQLQFPLVTHLDLAGNLIHQYQPTIALIFQHFPNLTSLSLAGNHFQPHSQPGDSLKRITVPALTHLNLYQTQLDPQQWYQWHIICPNILDLCIAYTNLQILPQITVVAQQNLTAHKHALHCLEALDASHCQLESLQTLVSWTPNLQRLTLDHNPLSRTKSPSTFAWWPHLRELHLQHTALAEWDDLCPMVQQMPQLRHLRITHCPLLDGMSTQEARHAVIVRLPQLESLNGSTISDKERHQAERRYLAHTTTATNNNNNHDDDDLYQQLASKHQDLLQQQSSFCDILNVTVVSMLPHSCTYKPWVRRLPVGVTLGRLKLLLEKVFELDRDLMTFTMLEEQLDGKGGGVAVPIPNDNDEASLWHLGIADGAKLFLHELEAPVAGKGARMAGKDWERRVDEQEEALNSFHDRARRAVSS